MVVDWIMGSRWGWMVNIGLNLMEREVLKIYNLGDSREFSGMILEVNFFIIKYIGLRLFK